MCVGGGGGHGGGGSRWFVFVCEWASGLCLRCGVGCVCGCAYSGCVYQLCVSVA